MGVVESIGFRRIATGVIIGGIFMGVHVFADTPQPSVPTQRQMIEQIIACVRKRVATSTVSYRDAIRACKDAARDEADTPAKVAADTRHRGGD
jgi:hypothetical protein